MTFVDVRYKIEREVLIVQFAGEIDMSNAGAIVDAVTGATPNDVDGVVLDMTGIDYLDSAGIHMIYRLRDALSTRGQLLALVIGPGSPVHDALQLSGVKNMVEIDDTVAEALAKLSDADKDPASA
jgi:anti-anti-sigma factor